jgi:hypothetical protein
MNERANATADAAVTFDVSAKNSEGGIASRPAVVFVFARALHHQVAYESLIATERSAPALKGGRREAGCWWEGNS